MTRSEFDQVVELTVKRLNISKIPERFYDECDGHPYVAKILLGELSKPGSSGKPKRLMAAREDILEVLFERTFADLTRAEERVFITLCAWRSQVPRIGLEAALLRTANDRIDVEQALEGLSRSSLIEIESASDDSEFVSVPLAASVFGSKKLLTSEWRAAVEADLEYLHLFGASQRTGLGHGLVPRVERFIGNVAARIEAGSDVTSTIEVLKYVIRHHPTGWREVARLQRELGPIRRVARYRGLLTQIPRGQSCRYRGVVRTGSRIAELWELSRRGQCRFWQAGVVSGISFDDISRAANRMNSFLKHHDYRDFIDTEEKRIVVMRLAAAMAKRIQEGDGTDYSRLAWLYLNVQKGPEAASRR